MAINDISVIEAARECLIPLFSALQAEKARMGV
jgi:hypothetical protein